MATALRLRRGTTTQHGSFTGLEGEVTVDTTKDTVVVHDGSTAGGFPLAKETGSTVAVANGTVSAPGLTTSGDTNTGIFFPAADTIGLATGGSERVRVDSSGNVGTGVTPSAWNSSWKANQVGSYGAVSVLTNQTNLTNNLFYNASNNWVYLNTNAAAVYAQVGGQHIFQSAASGTAGNNVTTLTSVLQVDRAKTLALENASPQSGTGITFPATQSASTDANTLDDYEEGTWTPSIGGTATYTIQKGTYTKVGRLITCHFRITINARGTGSTTLLSGLPFSSSNDSYGDIFSGPCSYFASIGANTYCLSLYVPSNSTTIYFVGQDGLDGTCVNVPAVFANSADIAGSITYFSA